MSDNPFLEPDDDGKTVIKPTPGRSRRRPGAAPPSGQGGAATDANPRPPSPPAVVPVAEGADKIVMGNDVLTDAAAPLLLLMARLRDTAHPPDSGDLYQRTARQIQIFEQEAREKGVPREQLIPAHYALCASIDDVVHNTPWGHTGDWAADPLGSHFHKGVQAGKGFFDLLKQMSENPARFLPVIKLMYLCMSLGFVGQYRLSQRGIADHNRIREDTYSLIVRHQQQPPASELAPHTKGIVAPYRPQRFRLPLWVAAVAGTGVVAGLYLWISFGLNSESDEVYRRMSGAPPNKMPAIARVAFVPPSQAAAPVTTSAAATVMPPEETVLDRLRRFLKPEIDQKQVEVIGTPAQPVVRILGRGMFPSGSATAQPNFKPLLERIGLALKEERGPVKVIGYTDTDPIRTAAFPSNFKLSEARAKSALGMIAASIGDPSRLTPEGRGEANPIGDNATVEGRERNRRIEVILDQQD